MYATRFPAAVKAGINPQGAAHLKDSILPSKVARIEDNYNQLFEQPTQYSDQTAVNYAWSFVILRIVHSLIQSTINIVMLRLAVFTLSWIVLLVMMVREASVIF